MRVLVAAAGTFGLTLRDTRTTLLACYNFAVVLRSWERCDVGTMRDSEFRHAVAEVANICLGTLVILKYREFGGRGRMCFVKQSFLKKNGFVLLL